MYRQKHVYILFTSTINMFLSVQNVYDYMFGNNKYIDNHVYNNFGKHTMAKNNLLNLFYELIYPTTKQNIEFKY